MIPNTEQVGDSFRTLITVLLTIYATKLNLDNTTIASIAAALTVLVPWAWGMWAKTNKNIIASAAAVPNPSAPDGKTVVVTSKDIASALPAENVVSSTDKIVLAK